LLIVDGSASSSAQDYAIATEFASTCADLSSNWEFAVVRGGQNPEILDLQMTKTALRARAGFQAVDENTARVTRNSLTAKLPLGATDLIATFEKAAELADGRSIQMLYVGDGVDTVSELSGPAIASKIAALFADKNVKLSTVALGSTYDGTVLQTLAN